MSVPTERHPAHPARAYGQDSEQIDAALQLIRDLLNASGRENSDMATVPVHLLLRGARALEWALEEISWLDNDIHVGNRLLDIMLEDS